MQKSQIQSQKKRYKVLYKGIASQLKDAAVLLSMDEQLGKGEFGEGVYIAYLSDQIKKESKPEVYAIKQIRKNKSSSIQNSIENEKKILEKMQKSNYIVNFKKIQIESEKHVYLLMEYCNGSSVSSILQNKLGAFQNFSDAQIFEFIYQVATGYLSLKNDHIIHRDIKPENMMMHEGFIKIADFGFSIVYSSEEDLKNLDFAGSPYYAAPESLLRQASEMSDMYSLGMTVHRLSYKRLNVPHPYKQTFTQQDAYRYKFDKLCLLKDIIVKPEQRIFFPSEPKRCPELEEIIQAMTEIDPKKRISWEKLLQHPDIIKAQNSKLFTQYVEKYECKLSPHTISQLTTNTMTQSQFGQFEASYLSQFQEQKEQEEDFEEVPVDYEEQEHTFNDALCQEINNYFNQPDFQKFKEILFQIYESREMLFQFKNQINKLLKIVLSIAVKIEIDERKKITQNVYDLIMAMSIYLTNILFKNQLNTTKLFLKSDLNDEELQQFKNSKLVPEIIQKSEAELNDYTQFIQKIIDEHPQSIISANTFFTHYFEDQSKFMEAIRISFSNLFKSFENLNLMCESNKQQDLSLIMFELIQTNELIQSNYQFSLFQSHKKKEKYSIKSQKQIKRFMSQTKKGQQKILLEELKCLDIEIGIMSF